ncbi:DNA helicase [Tanacetum coccineum]
MSHDIPERVSEMTHIPNYHLNDDSLQGYILYELEIILTNCDKSLQHFGLGSPPPGLLDMLTNRLLMEERNYKQEELQQERNESIPNTLRCEGKIVLAVASSGIASLLLPSGRTAHSRFKLPIELTEESLCKVTKNSQLGKLLADTDVIIWHEAPMNDRRCFEALDRSLRDILTMPHLLFGGKSILLGGDFRQTLPVKKGASKMEIIASPGVSADERNLISSFASWLLDIGDGRTGEPDQEDPENNNWIDIPLTYCLPDDEQCLSKLIDFIYDQMTLKTPSAITLQEKAIVHDEAVPLERDGAETEMFYPVEHLNTLKFPGFPPHRLELKIGAPVMLLRNVNVAGGLCNRTRMIVRQMMMKLIEVLISTDISEITRKPSKTNKHGHENGGVHKSRKPKPEKVKSTSHFIIKASYWSRPQREDYGLRKESTREGNFHTRSTLKRNTIKPDTRMPRWQSVCPIYDPRAKKTPPMIE